MGGRLRTGAPACRGGGGARRGGAADHHAEAPTGLGVGMDSAGAAGGGSQPEAEPHGGDGVRQVQAGKHGHGAAQGAGPLGVLPPAVAPAAGRHRLVDGRRAEGGGGLRAEVLPHGRGGVPPRGLSRAERGADGAAFHPLVAERLVAEPQAAALLRGVENLLAAPQGAVARTGGRSGRSHAGDEPRLPAGACLPPLV